MADGEIDVDGERVPAGVMVVLEGSDSVTLRSTGGARVMLLGGDPLGERHMYWNFVSDSIARIDVAKEDWREHRFPRVPGDDERIPLPGED